MQKCREEEKCREREKIIKWENEKGRPLFIDSWGVGVQILLPQGEQRKKRTPKVEFPVQKRHSRVRDARRAIWGAKKNVGDGEDF